MINKKQIPTNSYGILKQDKMLTSVDESAEQVKRLGYTTLDSGLTTHQIKCISDAFNKTLLQYRKKYSDQRLKSKNEYYSIRALLSHDQDIFVKLATNKNLLAILSKLIEGTFILNQQNGIINPPKKDYNQGSWHRDLPYQHFVSTTPLAVNALFCVDDFTFENGSTFIIPGSHKFGNYPSDKFIEKNAIQIEAKPGDFIVLDCMVFHSGGYNSSQKERRAINHVYTIPYFKQQISLPNILEAKKLEPEERDLLGFSFDVPTSVDQFIEDRKQ